MISIRRIVHVVPILVKNRHRINQVGRAETVIFSTIQGTAAKIHKQIRIDT